MNPAEVSGLASAGLHETYAGEQSYPTECPEMNQDPFHETTKFEASMTTPAKYSGCSNSNTSLDGYQHTGIMAGTIEAVEEFRFGTMQHLEGRVSDSDEESLTSSPETSSTTNYVSGYMEQNLENTYNTLDEMDDQEGPVMLMPDFVLCDMALLLQPHLTFSSDGFKIEHFDCDSHEDDKMVDLYWDVSDIICINSKWTQTVESASITLMVRSSAETKSSGPIRVEFCLTDRQWPQIQEQICYLASRYHEIWNNAPPEDFALERSIEPSLFFPKQYFSGTDDFEDIIYPKGDRDAVSISSRDVDLLLPETFVNDTIIDFYIKYLSTSIKTTERCRYHFFNSFFFRKLADLDKDQGRAPEGRSAFLRVRKWTRKIDIFAKDFLFIPVNFSLHWSLIVICHPGELVRSEDDEAEKHGKVPCILHMDSLKGSHNGLKDIIQSYLWEEWKERHPESASDISDKFSNLRFVSLELPQQDNSFDCGLFLLHYVERFLMDAPRSFNPLKIDLVSTFLSDNWFVPAEASLKRSLIRKLIHELVTGPSRDFPILNWAKEQFDERHQISESAEQEAVVEFLAQGCSAGDSDSVCRIPGTQLESTSICFYDRGKGLPVSGFVLETPEVTTFAVEDMQVCPPDNDSVVCFPSQVVENDPTLADSDNQSDLRLCAPEGAEALKDDGCVVKDRDTYEESVLDYLYNSQKISSQAEDKVHDTMDPEVMASKQHILETNVNEVVDGSEDMHPVMMSDASNDDIANDPASTNGEAENDRFDLPDILETSINEVVDGSEDMHPVMMSDASIDDIANDPASTNGEAEIGRFDLPDVMEFDAVGDINGNVSGHSLEKSAVKAEGGIGDISDDTGSDVIGELDKDVPEHSVESEDTKPEDIHEVVNETEDTHDNVKVEDVDSKGNNNKTEDTHEDVNVEDEIEVTTNETEDTHDNVKVEDFDSKGNNNETEDAHEDVKVEDDTKVNESETCTAVDEMKGNTENCITSDRLISCESKEGKTDNIMAGDSESEADEAHPDGVGAQGGNLGAVKAVPCEDDTTCTDVEMPSIDSTSCAGKETVCEDKPSDAKRPLPDSTSEVENTRVSDDKCSPKDVPRTKEKQERRHKRRKVAVTPVTERRRTRSSSRRRPLA